MSLKMYRDQDARPELLKDKCIAIIGYGNQGHAQAQNLRDSGYEVIVAEPEGTENYKLALKHGFEPFTALEAARKGDIVHILLPDGLQKKIYESYIADAMKPGKALVFSHGFNIHYKRIVPPEDIDVYMVSPKGVGTKLRELYKAGSGVPALIAVHQDAGGNAKGLALAHACGIGSGRMGIFETSFAEETEADLFGEQAVLCGGLSELIRAGFDTLVEAGYKPEIAYFECLHEIKLIADLIYKNGISGMRDMISDTAEYGDLTRGRRIINLDTREEMKNILSEIRSGEFAEEWIEENRKERPRYHALKERDEKDLIEQVGAELRKKMYPETE